MNDTEHVVEILTNEDGSPVTWEQFKAQYAADVEPVEVETITETQAVGFVAYYLAVSDSVATDMLLMARDTIGPLEVATVQGVQHMLNYAGSGLWTHIAKGKIDYSPEDPGAGHSASGFAANH